jgi:hypothetical protein
MGRKKKGPAAPAEPTVAPVATGGGVSRGRSARRRLDPITIRDDPEGVVAEVRGERPLLSAFLPGPENEHLRRQILQTGVYRPKIGREVRIATQPRGDGEHEIIQMAAVVARNPGTIQDIIGAFDDLAQISSTPKVIEVQQHWNIYNNIGVINASVNKLAALLSAGGSFKVRTARKGKKQKAREELQAALDEVNTNVNNAPVDGVVTGVRGLKAVTQQGVRQGLVEGDWFGRTLWSKHKVRDIGVFSLPMLIQQISTSNMEPIPEILTSNLEAWYWRPDQQLIQQLTQPKDAVVRDLLKRYVDSKTLAALKKDGKVFLDQSLLLHVKHRGIANNPYGESFIKPSLYAVAFKRAVEQLDLVMINSLINRLTIVQVGSSSKDSPYSDPAVAAARQALMQSFFDDTGPNMTIIWQGDDVKVTDVGAHATVATLDGRHKVGEQMIKEALGIPDALLTGASADGKASAFASLLSVGSALDELKTGFEGVWTTLGQRVAEENGYTDVEIIYEYDNAQILDHTEERNQARLDYVTGAMSIRSLILARGQDPDAEFRQACFERGLDPETALWKDAFAPIKGLPGQGQDGNPPGLNNNPTPSGRTPDSVTGRPAKPPTETKTPVENK